MPTTSAYTALRLFYYQAKTGQPKTEKLNPVSLTEGYFIERIS